MIKPKEAESAAEARMGTAGTCSPGKTYAEFFTSVVSVCLWKGHLAKKEFGTTVC